MRRIRRFPVLTAIAVSLTAACSASRLAGTGLLHAFWRDPSGLEHGQLWRLLTPVLVQSDPAWVVVEVLILCGVVGALAERVFPRRRWISLYLVGALAGHSIGEFLQPHQGGTSVAFAGLLGGLAAEALLGERPVKAVLRVEAALAIPLAIVDTAVGDIHGLPFLAGFAVAGVWRARDAARARASASASATGRSPARGTAAAG
ncbi:MAG TPA: rhomboid family intramembrane serine protease [Solirubrobacteraceae bacterium]